jgi:hypothetical protein
VVNILVDHRDIKTLPELLDCCKEHSI